MRQLGSTDFLAQGVANQTTPDEGPKAVPVRVDFSVDQNWALDLSVQSNMAILRAVQSMFVDNSLNPAALYIQATTLRQTIVVPPFSQGYIPILAVTPTKLVLNSTGGVVVMLHFLNVPMPLHIWGIASSTFNLDGNGFVQTSVPGLETLISSGGLNVNYVNNGRLPPDFAPRRFAITTAASTTLMTVTASQVAYVDRLTLTVSPDAIRAAAGVTRISLQINGAEIWETAIYVPAVAGTGPAPLLLVDVANMDYTRTGTGNVTLVMSTAFTGGNIYATLWGGTKPIP